MNRILGAVCGICIMLCGCSGADNGMYQEAKTAVEAVLAESGGEMLLQSSSSEGEALSLKFNYCYDAEDVLQYWVEQSDQTGRPVFSEHHDGKILQRWLLGHGTLSFDETSAEFIRYTREQPYQYLAWLQEFPDKKAVLTVSRNDSETGTEYLFELDPRKTAGSQTAGQILIEKHLRCLISPEGRLSEYEEISRYANGEDGEISYTLKAVISKLGEISELPNLQTE